jgi:hypothetical protein
MAKKNHPTAKAKKAYYGLIQKSYKRLRAVMMKHHPEVIRKEG